MDVTNLTSDIALSGKIVDAISGIDSRNYLNIIFCGALTNGVHLDVVANSVLNGRFFALRIDDQTTTNCDLKAIAQETSLRGEFVKLANQLQDEKLKAEVLKTGLQALSGEDIV